MDQKIIEGTWEEIARKGSELAGRRIRVTVLDDISATTEHGGPAASTAIPEHLLDHDAVVFCEREADDGITLEEARTATSSIKGSMARVVIEQERAERF